MIELDILLAVGVRDRQHKIGAFLAQQLGLLPHGWNAWQELQVPRARCARGVVERGAGETDAHAIECYDRSVSEIRQRLAAGVAKVGGEERELRFRHPLEEHRLPKIELVIAGREDIRRD